jgi:DNA-binding transcriptional LysR family regulator
MDLWQLHIFCKVVEHKSFSKAAKIVHISQPTISSHIKDLENHFSCRLIDRLSREAVPTKAGELLYQNARRLLALRDETEMAIHEFNGKIKGKLVVGGSTIPGEYILPRIIGAFSMLYPEVSIHLIIGDTRKIINDTLSGECELGFVGAQAMDNSICQEKLIEDEMKLVIPFDHKWSREKSLPLATLLKEPFIIRESGSGTLESVETNLNTKGYSIRDFNIAAVMGSTTAVIQGIKSKVGVSIISTMAISEDLQSGKLIALNIDGLYLKRSFYLTRHRHRSPSPVSQSFIKFLEEELDYDKSGNQKDRKSDCQ